MTTGLKFHFSTPNQEAPEVYPPNTLVFIKTPNTNNMTVALTDQNGELCSTFSEEDLENIISNNAVLRDQGTATNLTLQGSLTEQVFTSFPDLISLNNGTICKVDLSLVVPGTPADVSIQGLTSGRSIVLMFDNSDLASGGSLNWSSLNPVWVNTAGAPVFKETGATMIFLWNVLGVVYGMTVGAN